MNSDAMNVVECELQRRAAVFGLDAAMNESGEGYCSFDLYIGGGGGKHVGTIWYMEAFNTWTDAEPAGQSLDTLLSTFSPTKSVRREEEYLLSFNHGRRTAPDEAPVGGLAHLLDAAVTMAKEAAPDAVKVTVTSRSGRKTAKLS